jgi:CubicO group peptidase (beta-lactamase class C family)
MIDKADASAYPDRMKRPALITSAIILLGLIRALSCGPGREAGGLVSTATIVAGEPGRRIDEFLSRLSGFGYQGAMLVVRRGDIVLRKGYGPANREENIPNVPDTLFDVGSFAKTFTAAAVLQLEAAGRLKVTDPIGKYLAGVPADKAAVTIHQALTHTAGLQDDFGTYEDIGRDEALTRIFKLPLQFAPGSDFAYSNGGYVVLAAVVETAGGVPFREYIKRNIFERAGMRDTGFWGAAAPPVKPSRIARGYDELGEVGNPLTWSGTTWYDLGGGMVLSTVDDLAKWVSALDGSGVIPREAAVRMFTPVAKEISIGGYGYGWWIKRQTPYGTMIQHGGDSTGFGAQVTWYKDEGVVFISLCNIRHDWFPTHVRADRVVPKILFGESYAVPPAFMTSGAGADRITGTYELATGGKFVVRRDRGQLEIGAEGQDAATILAGAAEEQRPAWADQSAKTKLALEGLMKGDFALFDAATGEGGRGFRNAVVEELRALGKDKGDLKAIQVIGTSPAGYPSGALATLLRFDYDRGTPLIYRVVWTNGVVAATSDRTAALSAATPIQAQSDRLFVGWDIIAEKGFQIAVESAGERVTGITLFRDNKGFSIPAGSGSYWPAKRLD